MHDGKPADLKTLYAEQLRAHGFQPDPLQLAAIERLDELRERLIANPPSVPSLPRRLLGFPAAPRRTAVRGAYLWGSVGRGKTWMMDLFFQSLPFAEKRRTHFHRFMHDVHAELATLRNLSDPLASVAGRIALSTRVLCLDELFVSDIADAMILANLFRALLEREVALVITSNVPPGGLYRDGLQRQKFVPAIRLLEKHTDVIAVDGGLDYRLRQLTQAPIYLDTADPGTPGRLAALFSSLSADAPASCGPIEVAGRRIDAVRECDGVAWFDFAAICEGPRSQEDYIELAREYQSVIVTGVPVFDARSDDAARRFIALVDEFYDRGVNLIVSAAAGPTALYRGERLVFEFQRTTSRLIEMQSEEYLAREHRA